MKVMKSEIVFVDDEILDIYYSTLLIRVKSISEHCGSLIKFNETYGLGGVTNGKILYLEDLCKPSSLLEAVIRNVLEPLGFAQNRDYILTYEKEIWKVQKYLKEKPSNLNKSIPELSDVDWLESIVTYEGQFVWYV